jgi:hypothetical protein
MVLEGCTGAGIRQFAESKSLIVAEVYWEETPKGVKVPYAKQLGLCGCGT